MTNHYDQDRLYRRLLLLSWLIVVAFLVTLIVDTHLATTIQPLDTPTLRIAPEHATIPPECLDNPTDECLNTTNRGPY